MKIKLLLSFFLLNCSVGFSQFTLNTSSFSTSEATTISVSGDLTFNNSGTNGNAILVLSGTDQTISTSTARSLPNLVITGGGSKNFNGDFIVSTTLSLQDGLIVPSGNFTLSANAIIDGSNSGSAASHISGKLNREYNGSALIYPIGVNGSYNPVTIETASGTNPVIGITSLSGAAGNVTLPSGVTDFSNSWSWEISSPAPDNFSTAQLTLPFLAEDKAIFGDDGYRPVVLYNEAGQSTATLFSTNPSGSSVDNFVTALDAGRLGTYFVGKELLFLPVINNVITPDGNSMNDYLSITNLSLYPDNDIKLIDRYGVIVYEKQNYVSPLADGAPGDGDDFSFLAAGNYVCILKYKDLESGETIKLRQTITVLQ